MVNNKKIVAGLDTGSMAVKVALYDGSKLENWITPAGWSPAEVTAGLLAKALGTWGAGTDDVAYSVGTGYGRMGLSFITKAVTEIACHARGAVFLWPGAHTVIDIGGQDAKAIRVDERGKVIDFVMNDKCAAGTGRFLQVMAHVMGLTIEEMGQMECPDGENACVINAMCTVFAESEVIGLINKGFSRQAVLHGLYRSIASRVAAMAAGIQPEGPVIFTGGVAQNRAMGRLLGEKLGMTVHVPDQAVFAGAIGAALFAWEELNK